MSTFDSLSPERQDVVYADLMKLIAAEVGADPDPDEYTAAELEEARANVQSAALELFPEIDAPELFPLIDEIASSELGVRW